MEIRPANSPVLYLRFQTTPSRTVYPRTTPQTPVLPLRHLSHRTPSRTPTTTTATPSQQLIRSSRHSSQSTLAFHRTRYCSPGKRLRTSPVDGLKRGKAARKGERDNDELVLSPQPPSDSDRQSADQHDNTDPDIASQDTVTQQHVARVV